MQRNTQVKLPHQIFIVSFTRRMNSTTLDTYHRMRVIIIWIVMSNGNIIRQNLETNRVKIDEIYAVFFSFVCKTFRANVKLKVCATTSTIVLSLLFLCLYIHMTQRTLKPSSIFLLKTFRLSTKSLEINRLPILYFDWQCADISYLSIDFRWWNLAFIKCQVQSNHQMSDWSIFPLISIRRALCI